jgi:hypothetical protein
MFLRYDHLLRQTLVCEEKEHTSALNSSAPAKDFAGALFMAVSCCPVGAKSSQRFWENVGTAVPKWNTDCTFVVSDIRIREGKRLVSAYDEAL